VSKGKIFFSYYQVVLLMGQVYSVEYPPNYQAFEANFNWVGMNLMMEIDCFSRVTFMMKLVGATLFPLGCVFVVVVFGYCGMSTTKQQVKKNERRNKMISSCLLITFIFLPTASFYIFQRWGRSEATTIYCITP
jgi:hypothetical protein